MGLNLSVFLSQMDISYSYIIAFMPGATLKNVDRTEPYPLYPSSLALAKAASASVVRPSNLRATLLYLPCLPESIAFVVPGIGIFGI